MVIGLPNLLSLIQKLRFFLLLFTENDDIMSRVRQMLFGAQFADLSCFI